MWVGIEVRPVLNRVLSLLDVSFGNGQGTYLILGQREDEDAARGVCFGLALGAAQRTSDPVEAFQCDTVLYFD